MNFTSWMNIFCSLNEGIQSKYKRKGRRREKKENTNANFRAMKISM